MLLHRLEHPSDSGAQFSPCVRFRLELCASFPRELVIFRAPIVIGRAPARFDPAPPFETMQSRIERPLADLERRPGDLMQPFGDRPAVLRLKGNGLEDQQVEGALGQFESLSHSACSLPATILLLLEGRTPLLSKDNGKPKFNVRMP